MALKAMDDSWRLPTLDQVLHSSLEQTKNRATLFYTVTLTADQIDGLAKHVREHGLASISFAMPAG